jgi:uncharacterized protein
MNHVITWFELPVNDFERAKKFYNEIFGWNINEAMIAGFQMGFFPMEEGAITGALVYGENYTPSSDGALVYFHAGDDLTEILNKVEPSGGKVLIPKTPITPEIGFFAIFIDSEGNRVALHSRN